MTKRRTEHDAPTNEAATEPENEPATEPATGGRPGTPGRGLWTPTTRLVVALVLALLLVAAIVVSAWSINRIRPVEAQEETRQEVTRAAEGFAAAVNSYDSKSIEGYQDTIRPMLSTKFRTEFEKAMEDIATSVREADMSSKGEVLVSGVASVDEDSARVLVVADADVKTVFDTRQRHFRWQVDLVKVDDAWLVDDFTPVA